MYRLVAVLLAACVILSGCGARHNVRSLTPPHLHVTPATNTSVHRVGICGDVHCGAYAVNFTWDVSIAGGTGYYVFVNGVQIASPTTNHYTVPGLNCGTTYTIGVEAHDGSGNTTQMSTTPYTPSCGSAPQTYNCFNSPSACGYPDPTTVGVPNCSGLPVWTPSDTPGISASGSQANVTSPNVTISGYQITGYFFYVQASGFTLNNDCLNFNGSLRGTDATAVWGDSSGDAVNLTIENSTIVPPTCTASATAICNNANANNTLITSGGGANTLIKNNVLAGAVEVINGVGNNSTIQNNYIVANGEIGSGNHTEGIFESSDTAVSISVIGTTMLDPVDQTAAAIFAQATTSNNPCEFSWTVTGNLIAGGGWPIQLCAHTGSVGGSTANVSNNDFGRCSGTPTGMNIVVNVGGTNYGDAANGGSFCGSGGTVTTTPAPNTPACAVADGTYCHSANGGTGGLAVGAGMDSNGYWPNGGYFGTFASNYFGNSGWSCSGNFWDNNNTSVTCA